MYCSVEEAKAEASLSTNKFIADDEVNLKITGAESIINGYLSAKYGVPFADGSVPYLINYICTLLAAGMLLKKDYGPMSPGDSKDGQDKITMGMNMLKDVQKGAVVLTDATGQSLLSSDKQRVSFNPSDATSSQQANPDANFGPGHYGQGAIVPNTGNGPYVIMEKKW